MATPSSVSRNRPRRLRTFAQHIASVRRHGNVTRRGLASPSKILRGTSLLAIVFPAISYVITKITKDTKITKTYSIQDFVFFVIFVLVVVSAWVA
jgi:hypothetical protein